MRPARGAAELFAGLLLFDVLVNLPGLSLSSPFSSLLVPSIDLLVIAAACMAIAQAGEPARVPLRIALGVLAVFLVSAGAGLRFGFNVPSRLLGSGGAAAGVAAAGWALSILILAAAGAAAYVISGLLVRGFQPALIRSVMLLVISLAAVMQVVSGRRIFSASVIPRLIALAGQAR
jgi:hypothetical protein